MSTPTLPSGRRPLSPSGCSFPSTVPSCERRVLSSPSGPVTLSSRLHWSFQCTGNRRGGVRTTLGPPVYPRRGDLTNSVPNRKDQGLPPRLRPSPQCRRETRTDIHSQLDTQQLQLLYPRQSSIHTIPGPTPEPATPFFSGVGPL